MKKFPHLVQLHQKLSEKGLVCVSLDVEQDEWKDDREKVEKFLKDRGATFANFIFQDDAKTSEAWLEKLDATGRPAYIAWNRAGKPVKMPGNEDQAKPEFMEKFVADLLAEK